MIRFSAVDIYSFKHNNQADHGLRYGVEVEDMISKSVKLPNGGRDCIDVLRGNTQAQAQK